jgi:hypothetical protein
MSSNADRRATGRARVIDGVNVKKLSKREAARLALKALDDKLMQEREKASLNATCFYQGCAAPPIKSHIISRKLLRRIAESSHVLTWSSPDASLLEMADAMDAGESVELFNMIPILVVLEMCS